jgi:hypothetical protein
VVKQTIEQVWEFLANPLNSNKWDKSVARVILPESGFTGIDCVVDTVSPSGMQQSFIITEFQSPNYFKFQLLKSSMFKNADLSFFIEKVVDGTRITHEINITLLPRSFYLYPILLLTQKRALRRDMKYLRNALDENYISSIH